MAAARRMRDEDVGCPLVGERNRVLGIITDRDIVVRTLASGLHAMREQEAVAAATMVFEQDWGRVGGRAGRTAAGS